MASKRERERRRGHLLCVILVGSLESGPGLLTGPETLRLQTRVTKVLPRPWGREWPFIAQLALVILAGSIKVIDLEGKGNAVLSERLGETPIVYAM